RRQPSGVAMSDIESEGLSWLDAAGERFERAWEKGTRPRLEDFLAGVPEPRRPALLGHLLAIELERRRAQGERPQRDEYLRRFPADRPLVEGAFQAIQGDPGTLYPEGRTPDGNTPPPGNRACSGNESESPEAGPSLPGYRVLERLGEGGMAQVYKARHEALGRLVALKVIRPELLANAQVVARFRRWARAAARLAPPDIVSLYDAGRGRG